MHLQNWQEAKADLIAARDKGLDIADEFYIRTSKVLKAFERIIGFPLPVDISLLLAHQVIEPHSADTYITRGTAYLKNNNYDLAIADFSKAIELEPETLLAYKNRGIAYYITRANFTEPVDDFSKIISLIPDDPLAYFGSRNGLP